MRLSGRVRQSPFAQSSTAFFYLLLGISVALLQSAFQLLALAIDRLKIILGEECGRGGPVHCLAMPSASRAQKECLLACPMTASGQSETWGIG